MAHTAAQFTTTHWSVVLTAGQGSSPQVSAAMEKLCGAYWYPLYAYVRRQGYSVPDAEDLTQSFFASLLARNDLARVHPDKGRFRSFLLAALKHFLLNEWKRARRLKRGGGQQFISLDAQSAETRYAAEPSHSLTPEKIYERRWALTLLEKTLGRLRDEYPAGERAQLFERLKGILTGLDAEATYGRIARDLGVSEASVKMAASRLRQRYRALLREEIAHTVANPAEIDDELRHLFVALQ